MERNTEDLENTSGGTNGDIPRKFNISGGEDLPDNPHDKERMQSETTILDFPDVEDIPGQENVRPAPLGELADTTISSDDEEGVGIFDDEEDDDLLSGDSTTNVTNKERTEIEEANTNMPTRDDQSIRNAALDNEDDDGEPLNEEGFGTDVSGSDLDVPGAFADDANEEVGAEDEENNAYSASDENNYNMSSNS